MHSKAMWPMHGKYICPDCFREYPVEWTGVPRDEETTYAWTAKQAKERLGTM
jgi:hypothetical protein